jgi:hypothetical protein
MNPPQGSPDRSHALVRYRWPLVIVAVAMMVLLAYVASLWTSKEILTETMARGGRAGRFAAEKAEEIAGRFMSGNITKTFEAAIPEVFSTGGGNLELATAEKIETFRTHDDRLVLWDSVWLGTTVSEIRVPVTYRYHLRLSEPWQLEVSNQTCIVVAPPIRPSLPPAIHTDRMEKKSEAGWARFNASVQMTELERGITPTLRHYAGDHRHINLVREECRKTVAEFVKTWLLKEEHWRTDRFSAIKVVFSDELETDLVPGETTLRLEMDP